MYDVDLRLSDLRSAAIRICPVVLEILKKLGAG